jgi:hypothetical protein
MLLSSLLSPALFTEAKGVLEAQCAAPGAAGWSLVALSHSTYSGAWRARGPGLLLFAAAAISFSALRPTHNYRV